MEGMFSKGNRLGSRLCRRVLCIFGSVFRSESRQKFGPDLPPKTVNRDTPDTMLRAALHIV